MEKNMKGDGRMINNMVKVYIMMEMAGHMVDNGKMVRSMGMGY